MANNKIQTKLFDLYKESKLNTEVDNILKQHLGFFENYSQLTVFNSLKENLKDHTYSKPVSIILEKLQDEIESDVVYYELENLYKVIEAKNQGMVYRPVMQVILDVMNETNAGARHKKIMNELKLHDWVKPVAEFMYRYTQNPLDKQNLTSRGGKAEPVYTFVESVEEGQLVYVKDKWFLIKEESIFPVVIFDYIKDSERLRNINVIQSCMELAQFSDETMNFVISEDLTLGISLKNGEILLNGDKAEASSTLESIFNSPLVPVLKRDFYLVIQECVKNKNQFKNLDIAIHITNILDRQVEAFAFNYKGNCYAYVITGFSGNTFFHYESASTLVNEIDQTLGFDLTNFFTEEIKAETSINKQIQDTQKLIYQQIAEVNENIEKLEESSLLEANEQIRKAHDMLKSERTALMNKLRKLGDKATVDIKTIINSESDFQAPIDIDSEINVELQPELIAEPVAVLEKLNESLVVENIVTKYQIFGKEFDIYGIKENKEDEDYFTFDIYCEGKLVNVGLDFYSVPSPEIVRDIAIEKDIV